MLQWLLVAGFECLLIFAIYKGFHGGIHMIQLLNNKLKIERVPALAPYVTLQKGI